MTAHLIRGDARRLPLRDGSVQCVVTSPPYLGLRHYGGQTSIWGGDTDCPHALAESALRAPQAGYSDKSTLAGETSERTKGRLMATGDAWVTEHRQGIPGSRTSQGWTVATCTLCGAWRGELGSEPTPALFVAHLVEVFRECWRVLRDDGVCFVNIGDSYAGSGKGVIAGPNSIQSRNRPMERQGFGNVTTRGRPKSLLLVPERLAVALSDDGWVVRQVLIWAKNNPMPESVRDRWTMAHEYVLMLVKQGRYFFDQEAIREPHARLWDERNGGTMANIDHAAAEAGQVHQGQNHRGAYPLPNPAGRNGRSVWEISTDPYKGAHYAVFPRELVRRCILAASREGDVVLDPFSGSGTTAYLAASLGRVGIGVELSAEYTKQARYGRLAQQWMAV